MGLVETEPELANERMQRGQSHQNNAQLHTLIAARNDLLIEVHARSQVAVLFFKLDIKTKESHENSIHEKILHGVELFGTCSQLHKASGTCSAAVRC